MDMDHPKIPASRTHVPEREDEHDRAFGGRRQVAGFFFRVAAEFGGPGDVVLQVRSGRLEGKNPQIFELLPEISGDLFLARLPAGGEGQVLLRIERGFPRGYQRGDGSPRHPGGNTRRRRNGAAPRGGFSGALPRWFSRRARYREKD